MRVVNGKRSAEYRAWSHMKTRCYNPNFNLWHRYGGRGIKVSSRWVNSFDNFYEDMGPRPSPKHSLDRICNWGNYGPSNCKWSTKSEQARNRHNNLIVIYQGKKMPLVTACELSGVNYDAAKFRVKKGHPFHIPIRSNSSDWFIRGK